MTLSFKEAYNDVVPANSPLVLPRSINLPAPNSTSSELPQYLKLLDSLVQTQSTTSITKIGTPSFNLDFFTHQPTNGMEVKERIQMGNEKAIKKVTLCPHRERKHYAKVSLIRPIEFML